MPVGGILALLLLAGGAPADIGKVELALGDARGAFAPDQPVPLRLRNGSSRPLFLIIERRTNLRTEKGVRFPGVPVHERRMRKFLFRSDRWVYTSGHTARFEGALLPAGDALSFDSRIARPGNYRIYVRYWWMEKPEEEKEFLQLEMRALETKYGRRARWLQTPTFRIVAPPQTKSD